MELEKVLRVRGSGFLSLGKRKREAALAVAVAERKGEGRRGRGRVRRRRDIVGRRKKRKTSVLRKIDGGRGTIMCRFRFLV